MPLHARRLERFLEFVEGHAAEISQWTGSTRFVEAVRAAHTQFRVSAALFDQYRWAQTDALHTQASGPAFDLGWLLFSYVRVIPPAPTNLLDALQLMVAVMWVLAHNKRLAATAAEAAAEAALAELVGAAAAVGDAPTPIARRRGTPRCLMV
jgi:hypothetical protein